MKIIALTILTFVIILSVIYFASSGEPVPLKADQCGNAQERSAGSLFQAMNLPTKEGSALRRPGPKQGTRQVGSSLLPSQAEIQQQLVNMGYDIGPDGVDGVVGEDSRKAWDRAINEQYALPIMREWAEAMRK